jgi:hypothetical protein
VRHLGYFTSLGAVKQHRSTPLMMDNLQATTESMIVNILLSVLAAVRASHSRCDVRSKPSSVNTRYLYPVASG